MSAGLGRAFSIVVFSAIAVLAVWAWLDPGAASRAPLRVGVQEGASGVPRPEAFRDIAAALRERGGPIVELVPTTLADLRREPAAWAAALVGGRARAELESDGWRALAAMEDRGGPVRFRQAIPDPPAAILLAAPGRRAAVERLVVGLQAAAYPPAGGSDSAVIGLRLIGLRAVVFP